jgi:hypothetical protein
MLRKTAACGIVGTVAAITAAILWWPTDVAVVPAPSQRLYLQMPHELPRTAVPAATTPAQIRPPAPQTARPRLDTTGPHAGEPSLTTPPAEFGRRADLVPAPLESRSLVGPAVPTPSPLPILVVARPEAGGSAMARTGRALGSAFKTTGASLTAAFARLF